MAVTSWLSILDNGMKQLIFNRFKEDMKLSNLNTGVVFAPREVAMRMMGEKRGAGTSEFISLWRDTSNLNWTFQQTKAGKTGLTIPYTSSSGEVRSISLKGVPVKLSYSFYVWSLDLDTIRKVEGSYWRWLHDNPVYNISFNNVVPLSMYMTFSGIEDATDYRIYEVGKHFVFKFGIGVDGWEIVGVDSGAGNRIEKIFLDIYVRHGASPDYHDELIDQYIIVP